MDKWKCYLLVIKAWKINPTYILLLHWRTLCVYLTCRKWNHKGKPPYIMRRAKDRQKGQEMQMHLQKKNTKREHFLRTELTAISLPILYLRLLRTIKKIRHVEPLLADEKQPIMAIKKKKLVESIDQGRRKTEKNKCFTLSKCKRPSGLLLWRY